VSVHLSGRFISEIAQLTSLKFVSSTKSMLSQYSFGRIVTDLINVLPGNSSVNTVQHATIDEAMFFCVIRATSSVGNGPMNSQSDT
jgi:hypothetical protein